jgi:hypothetical protein
MNMKMAAPAKQGYLHIWGNFPNRTPTHQLLVILKIPSVCNFITKKKIRHSADVTRNHLNETDRYIVQGEAQHNTKRLRRSIVEAS